MKHAVEFEPTPGGLKLTNAILLYAAGSRHQLRRDGSAATAFASMHKVSHGDAGPVIEAGTPLSRADLRKWTEAISRAAAPEILPGNVLVHHPDMLAWWTPARVRPGYFALSAPPAEARALGKRVVLPVPYPPHLLIATRRGLGVYALRSNKRPAANTPALHSPILNVFIDGSLCWGNVPRPKTLTIAAIDEFERALFDSWSTHPNPGQQATVRGKGGLVQLWDNLAARRATRFPVARLKPFQIDARRKQDAPVTVAQLIVRAGERP